MHTKNDQHKQVIHTKNDQHNYPETLEHDYAYWENFYGDMIEEDENIFYDTTLGVLNESTEAVSGVLNESTEAVSTDMTSIFTIDQAFDSHEDLTNHLLQFARGHRVVLVKKRSHLNEKRTPSIIFQCEKGGMPSDRYQKKVGGIGKQKPRNSKSKKCGCLFVIKGIQDRSTKLWKVVVDNGVHNHKIAKFHQGHAYLGRLNKEATDNVRRLSISGVMPKQILRCLRDENKDNCTSPKTIYNIRSKLNSNARDGRSVMQELHHLATTTPTFLQCRYDENNVVRDIFWAFEESLSLARCFPYVMLMDCTYKTNKYKMPHLQIIGVTSTNKSFCVGFALLGMEKEDNYLWALRKLREALGDKSDLLGCIVTDREQALMNAVRVVFPNADNLICLWHIEKNLAGNLKNKSTSEGWKEFMDRWKEVVRSSSEQEFILRLEELKSCCSEEAMKYISTTWLDSHKKEFVSAWTDSIFHLGNTSTSRVEGMHAKFKNWLTNGLGDAVKGWEAGLKMIDQEMNDIKGSFETSLFMVPRQLRGDPLFQKLIHNVSIHALEALYEEYKEINGSLIMIVDCSCTIKRTHRLPCKHDIARFVRNPGFIPLSTIDVHWKTLDIKGPPPGDAELDYEPVLNALHDKVMKASPFEKLNLLVKIRDICAPSQTVLLEPPIKRSGRGRPKGSGNKKKMVVDDSTKRDKCLFEHVDKALESVSSKAKKRVVRKKKLPTKRQKVEVNESLKDEVDEDIFKEEFDGGCFNKEVDDHSLKVEVDGGSLDPLPNSLTESVVLYLQFHFKPEIIDYILSYKNVLGDGNCGFRVIADFVYQNNEMWPKVKKELEAEMRAEIEHYMDIFGRNSDYCIRKCFEVLEDYEGICDSKHWFDSLLCWVVCNVYGLAFSVVSKVHGSQTFFPTKIKPLSEPPFHIWVGYINGDHFLRLYMKKNCPVPRVAKRWHYVRYVEATGWYSMFKERIGLWEVLYPNPGSWEGLNVVHEDE